VDFSGLEKSLKTAKSMLRTVAYVSGLEEPYRVLVSTILSARTKDETTASASERLFAKAKSFEALSRIGEAELRKLIYPVSFYRNKAKHLKALAKIILDEHEGKIPGTIDELVTLPGVGRKTANLVVSIAFGTPGVCVDTHVHRILNRWGMTLAKSPFETEMAVRKSVPEKFWSEINDVLVPFGKEVCKPISPHCSTCRLDTVCPKAGVGKKR
jgi:endonuclease III